MKKRERRGAQAPFFIGLNFGQLLFIAAASKQVVFECYRNLIG
jgi:hypothetical protein